MPLIVDTYNVLHITGVLPPELAGIDTAGLIRLVRRSRYRQERTTLVCDGTPGPEAPTGRRGGVLVRYAGPHRVADDLIVAMVQKSSIPRRLIVVSSDHEVARAARRRRCRTIRSEDFLRQLLEDLATSSGGPKRRPGPVGPLSEAQVRHWARLFDVDPDAPPGEGFEPTEEELEALLEPEAPTQAETETDAGGRPPEGDAGAGDEPRPAESPGPQTRRRQPLLPGRFIREAEQMLAEFESASQPGDPGEEDLAPDPSAARETPADGDARMVDDLLEELGHVEEAALPPEIIREAERLLEELEGDDGPKNRGP